MTTRPDAWRMTDLAHEAWWNVTSSGSRLRNIVVAYLLLGSLVASLGALEWAALRSRVDRLVSEGANVTMVAAVSDSARTALLAPRGCAALADLSGVEGVYAVGERRLMRVEGAGSALVPVVEVGYSSHLDLPQRSVTAAGVLMLSGRHAPSALADLSTVTIGGTLYSLAAVLPDALEAADLGAALVVPVPLDRMRTAVERCAVVDRVATNTPSSASLAAAARASVPMVIVTPMAADRLADESQQFVERPTRQLSVAVGLVAGLMLLLGARWRRSEIAVYRVSGTSRLSAFMLLTLEVVILEGVLTASILAGDVVLQLTTGFPMLSSVSHQALAIVTLSAVALGSAIRLAMTDVVSALKDR